MARPGEAVNANATATIFSFRPKQSDLTQGLEISIRSNVTKNGYWAGSGEGRGGEGRGEDGGGGGGRGGKSVTGREGVGNMRIAGSN